MSVANERDVLGPTHPDLADQPWAQALGAALRAVAATLGPGDLFAAMESKYGRPVPISSRSWRRWAYHRVDPADPQGAAPTPGYAAMLVAQIEAQNEAAQIEAARVA